MNDNTSQAIKAVDDNIKMKNKIYLVVREACPTDKKQPLLQILSRQFVSMVSAKSWRDFCIAEENKKPLLERKEICIIEAMTDKRVEEVIEEEVAENRRIWEATVNTANTIGLAVLPPAEVNEKAPWA